MNPSQIMLLVLKSLNFYF